MAGMFRLPCRVLLLVIASAVLFSNFAWAQGSVRMYQINKKEQQSRIRLGDAARQPGCHDLRFSKPLYRFTQVGFKWCSVYSAERCDETALIYAKWNGGKYRRVSFDETQPQAKLYPGSKWLAQKHDHEQPRVKSWFCEAE